MEIGFLAFGLDLLVTGNLDGFGSDKEFEVLAVHEDANPRVERKDLVPLLADNEELLDKAVQQDIDEPLDDEAPPCRPGSRRRFDAGREF